MSSYMTRKGPTSIRHVRIADVLWVAAAKKAIAEGRTISEVIRDLLRGYVGEDL